jgi:NMD protein affecting ribosome stability and mRNA decay
MEKICPRCGRSSGEVRFAGSFCERCAEEMQRTEPEAVPVPLCRSCGRVNVGGWRSKSSEALRKAGAQITFVPQLCTDCSRRSGGYFEAIIQLRGSAEKTAKARDALVARIEERSFVSKVEQLREGVDVYAGSRKAALEALREMRLKHGTSAKLFGVKDGRRVYRFTYCVRL